MPEPRIAVRRVLAVAGGSRLTGRSRAPGAGSPADPRARAGAAPGARATGGRSARPRNWGTRPWRPGTADPRAAPWAPAAGAPRGPAGVGRIRAPQYRPVSFIQRITKVAIWSRLMYAFGRKVPSSQPRLIPDFPSQPISLAKMWSRGTSTKASASEGRADGSPAARYKNAATASRLTGSSGRKVRLLPLPQPSVMPSSYAQQISL